MKKVNRILKCITTGKEITVKPDKYKKLLSIYGSEEAIEKKFVSYTVEKEARSPSLLFWFEHSLEFKSLKRKLEIILLNFKNSKRSSADILTLQNDAFKLFAENSIPNSNVEFIQSSDSRGGYVIGLKIKNIPFINEYTITYEN